MDSNLRASVVDGESAGSWPVSLVAYALVEKTEWTSYERLNELVNWLTWYQAIAENGLEAWDIGYALLSYGMTKLMTDQLGIIPSLDKGTTIGQPFDLFK